MDDVCHVLLPQSTQYTEEELALRQLVGELLLGGEVLGKHRIFHGILIKVLHGELLVGRDVEADDLSFCLRCSFLSARTSRMKLSFVPFIVERNTFTMVT